VTRDDVVRALAFLIEDPRMTGPVNVVAPGAVRQREFARILGRVLHRPAFLPAPAFALALMLGEMAGAMLLAGQHVHPARLRAAGFTFRDPALEPAFRRLLGQS
jgi:NAD dependent epimerase/dehydratase family enzyme